MPPTDPTNQDVLSVYPQLNHRTLDFSSNKKLHPGYLRGAMLNVTLSFTPVWVSRYKLHSGERKLIGHFHGYERKHNLIWACQGGCFYQVQTITNHSFCFCSFSLFSSFFGCTKIRLKIPQKMHTNKLGLGHNTKSISVFRCRSKGA